MKKISKKNLATKKLEDGHILAWNDGAALKFILAGHAVVTLESIADGSRNTYYVSQAVDQVEKTVDGKKKMVDVPRDRWFVNLLTGSDNTKSYRYLGCVDKKHGKLAFRTTNGTKKNKGATAENINRFGDVIGALVDGIDNSNATRIWHRGFCGHCCAPLTVPSSIATGLGPVCAKKLGVEMVDTTPSAVEQLGALAVAEMNEPEPEPTSSPVAKAHEKVVETVPAVAEVKQTIIMTEAPSTDAKDRLKAVLKKLDVDALDLSGAHIVGLMKQIDAVEALANLAKPKRSLKDIAAGAA